MKHLALTLALSSLVAAPAVAQTGPNLARGKPARQSSTGFGGAAARATDGRTDGVYNAGSVTHTQLEAGWLEVDLGEPVAVGTVVVHNRTDCCAERLQGARVELAAEPCTTAAPLASQTVTGPDAKAVLTFTGAPAARYLCVRHLKPQYLSVAEVEAYAPEAAADAGGGGELDGPLTLDCLRPAQPPPPEASDVSYLVAVRTKLWPPGKKIAVCFLSTFELDRAFVQRHADEWTRHANVSFDWLGSCADGKPADIRIGTRRSENANWWAPEHGGPLYGPCAGDACEMNMNLINQTQHIVLHEFGHALGLAHEQKNPKVVWNWDWDALRRDGKDLTQYEPLEQMTYSTQLDVYSVMMYAIPYRYIVGGKSAWLAAYPGYPLGRAYSELSEVDRTYIARLYPRSGARDGSFDSDKPRTITFYKHVRFGGEARTFITDMSNLREVRFNDTVSSVIGHGALYQGAQYSGNCLDIVGHLERMPAGWNDSITSVRIGASCPKVVAIAYKDTEYRGSFLQVTGDLPNLGEMNEEISSIRFQGAYKLALFTDPGFSGVCTAVTGDVVRTGELPVGNDRISSIAVGRDCPAPSLVLHQDTQFRGKTLTVTSDMPNLKSVGFNDSASSVRMIRGTAALYRDTEYRGACITVTGDVPQLSKTPVGNDSVSSIRIGRGC